MNSNFKNSLMSTWELDDASAMKIASIVDNCVRSNNSTPKNKLTAALKLVAKYENMTPEQALDAINIAIASENQEQPKEMNEAFDVLTDETPEREPQDSGLEGLFDES